MREMTFRDLQAANAVWARHNFPDAKMHSSLLGAVEEIGELCHAHLKIEQGIRIDEDHKAKQKDAVADIIIFLAHYCTLHHIDLQHEVELTWNEVKQRDWKAFPTNGVSA